MYSYYLQFLSWTYTIGCLCGSKLNNSTTKTWLNFSFVWSKKKKNKQNFIYQPQVIENKKFVSILCLTLLTVAAGILISKQWKLLISNLMRSISDKRVIIDLTRDDRDALWSLIRGYHFMMCIEISCKRTVLSFSSAVGPNQLLPCA